jgi:hypothetical protein
MVAESSSSENTLGSTTVTELSGKDGLGGSRAENAGVRLHIVHALSGVGSCWVVRESYA